jgi:hypothetical protein
MLPENRTRAPSSTAQPRLVMQRHRVGQRAVAIKDVRRRNSPSGNLQLHVRFSEPIHELARIPSSMSHLWVVAEQASRLGDVGVSDRHVAGLRGQLPNSCAFFPAAFSIRRTSSRNSTVRDSPRLMISKSKLSIKAGQHALYDILNVGIIAPPCLLSPYISTALPRTDGARKLVDRQVRPLSRTIRGEEPQAHHVHSVADGDTRGTAPPQPVCSTHTEKSDAGQRCILMKRNLLAQHRTHSMKRRTQTSSRSNSCAKFQNALAYP